MKLSFIVPIYNTAEYLSACINSLLVQDLNKSEYEIILVNDGSTDNSYEICSNFAFREPTITLLQQTNQGQAVARNRGLEIAKGDYIWFVDSDDYIASNCIADCITRMDSSKVDILAICAANHYKDQEEIRQFFSAEEVKIVLGKQFLTFSQFQHCVPFYLYRRSFLEKNSIRFKEGIFHEDNEILPRIFYPATKVLPYNKVLYHVNLREGSTTRSIHPKKSHDLIIVAKSLAQYADEKVEPKDKILFYDFIGNAINGSLLNSDKMDKDEIALLNKAWYDNSYLFDYMRKSSRKHYRVEGLLFSLFPRHNRLIYKLMKGIKNGFNLKKI